MGGGGGAAGPHVGRRLKFPYFVGCQLSGGGGGGGGRVHMSAVG